MHAVDLNWWAILVTLVVLMALGYVWYSIPVFGRRWMNLIGKKEADLKAGAQKNVIFMVILAFITVYVLANIVDWAEADTFGQGLMAGFWAWLLVGAAKGADYLFSGRPRELWLIVAGHDLVAFLLAGGILAAWH